MNQTWASFRSDPYYLTRYFSLHTIALVVISAVLINFKGLHFDFSFHYTYLFNLPFAVLFGIQIPVLMHNCMHGNLKSKTANFICGELSGLFALMSLGILRINHTLHHAYADSINDPHDPAEKNFVTFFFVSQLTGARIIEKKYLEYHGASLKNRTIFKFNIFLHYGGHVLRLMVWYLILGPELFISLYLPAFIVYSLAFAHVNYITHRRNSNGETEIINKDDNLYYNFINYIGSGVYYHKNHHNYPKLMNPRYLGNGEGM
jgi:fatty acid desaturase